MSTSGPDETPPPSELQGLDPKDLLLAGLETVPPITLPPQPADPDATIPVAGPRPSQPSAPQVELPLPEELTQLLPAGAYKIESFLGQGGMGAVYKGMQVRLKRPVAIKIMRRDMGKDYDFEARFEREAQAMAKLNHPNIVSVIDFGEAGADYLYIVMELIDGADLMDVIRGGQMTQEMALTLLPQVCDALQFAHDHGIVHRDIKPSNIMLTRDGRVKMCDFGLAKRYDVESSFRTQTGTGMGTPDYAAPEQFDPKANIDHRADIYALGVMIYQMITGQLPRGVWKPPSQRAEISPQWDDIVSRAMQSDPSDRYQQASEVKTDVSGIPLAESRLSRQAAEAAAAKAPQPRALASTPTKSRAPLLIGLIIGAVVIAVSAFFALRGTAPRSGGLQPPSQAAAITPGSSPIPGSAPQTLAPAIQNTPLIAQPLSESGWKSLISDLEEVPGKIEFEDGLLHLQNHTLEKGPASLDGVIRAQIRFRKNTSSPALVVRNSRSGSYKLSATTDKPGECKTVWLRFYPLESNTGVELGKYLLPKPVQAGDVLGLEFQAHGRHLQAMVNGVAAIDVHDSRLTAAGKWGIMANDGWFESVEVQTLPAAAAESWVDAFHDPSGLSFAGQSKPTITLAGMQMNGASGMKLEHGPARDGAVRIRTGMGTDGNGVSIRGRQSTGNNTFYALKFSDNEARLALVDDEAKPGKVLASLTLSPPYQKGQKYELELRIVGDRLTAKLDGKVIGDITDSTLQTGKFGVVCNGGTPPLVKTVEYLNLDKVVSPSPNLPVSKSSDSKFPPGQWVKLFTKPEDLPEELRKTDSGVKFEDGWLRFEGKPAKSVGVPSELQVSYAIRCRFKRDTVTGHSAGVVVRNGTDDGGQVGFYSFDLSPKQELLIKRKQSGPQGDSYPNIFTAKATEAELAQHEEVIEFGAVGDHLVARLGRSFVKLVSAPHLRQGKGFITRGGATAIRDIEVINLDGLPEAEALRLLGVDEQGNDLRGKTASVSPSPNLPVSKSPPAYPSGQWVSPFKDVTAINDTWIKAGATWTEGWVTPGQGNNNSVTLAAPNGRGKNWGVRARYRWQNEGAATILLRRNGKASDNSVRAYHFKVDASGAIFSRAEGKGSTQGSETTNIGPSKPVTLTEGTEVVLEAFAIGDKIYGRVNGQLFQAASDGRLTEGSAEAASRQMSYRDIEFINLDGLPEAEALRLLGVDEKGNDLRGKTGAAATSAIPTPVWRDALTEAPLKGVIAKADHTDKGYLLPPGNHWEFPAQPVRAGVIRVLAVTEAGSPNHLSLNFGLPGTRDHYQVFFRRKLNECGLSYLKEGQPERRLAVKQGVNLTDGEPHELLLARIADQFYFLLNGEVILQATEPDATARYLTLNCFGDTRARVQKVEYLNLDGVNEAEALRLLGVDEKGNDVRGKTGAQK